MADPGTEDEEKHESKAEARSKSLHDTTHGTFPLYVLVRLWYCYTVIWNPKYVDGVCDA